MSVTIYLVPDQSLNSNQPLDADIIDWGHMLTAWINNTIGPDYGEGWPGHYWVVGLVRGQPVPAESPHVWHAHIVAELSAPLFGYHTLSAAGVPTLFVGVDNAAMASRPLSLSLSHEIAETLVNRYCASGILAPYGSGQGLYLMECCDPVEGQPAATYQYNHRDYAVSNYVGPAYWNPQGSGPFDRHGYVQKPLTPAPGGRQAVYPAGTEVILH